MINRKWRDDAGDGDDDDGGGHGDCDDHDDRRDDDGGGGGDTEAELGQWLVDDSQLPAAVLLNENQLDVGQLHTAHLASSQQSKQT